MIAIALLTLAQWPAIPSDPPGTVTTRIVRLTAAPGSLTWTEVEQQPAPGLIYDAVQLTGTGNAWCLSSQPALALWITTDLEKSGYIGSEMLNVPPLVNGCVTLRDPPMGWERRRVVMGVVRSK